MISSPSILYWHRLIFLNSQTIIFQVYKAYKTKLDSSWQCQQNSHFQKNCIAQSTGIHDMILQGMLFGSRISSERTHMHQLSNFISLFRRFYTFSNDLFCETKRFQKFFTPSPPSPPILTSFLPQFLKREVYSYFKLKTEEFDRNVEFKKVG